MNALALNATRLLSRSKLMGGATAAGDRSRKSDNCSEWTVLTSLLRLTSAGSQAETVVRRLLNRFGSLSNLLARAGENGIGPLASSEACELLRQIHAVMLVASRARLEERPILACYDDLHRYLNLVLAEKTNEQARVLYLNSKNVLISDEVHANGSVSRVSIYIREIVKRAIATSATSIIAVHNHPSGDTNPSDNDISTCSHLRKALQLIEVSMYDNIIIGFNGLFSFRKNGLI